MDCSIKHANKQIQKYKNNDNANEEVDTQTQGATNLTPPKYKHTKVTQKQSITPDTDTAMTMSPPISTTTPILVENHANTGTIVTNQQNIPAPLLLRKNKIKILKQQRQKKMQLTKIIFMETCVLFQKKFKH